jgi:hypothetical protein
VLRLRASLPATIPSSSLIAVGKVSAATAGVGLLRCLVLLARLGRADGAALLAALVATSEFPPPSVTSAKRV